MLLVSIVVPCRPREGGRNTDTCADRISDFQISDSATYSCFRRLLSWMLCFGLQEAEERLWRQMLTRTKVNLTPGAAFHCLEAGWFRLCFAYQVHNLHDRKPYIFFPSACHECPKRLSGASSPASWYTALLPPLVAGDIVSCACSPTPCGLFSNIFLPPRLANCLLRRVPPSLQQIDVVSRAVDRVADFLEALTQERAAGAELERMVQLQQRKQEQQREQQRQRQQQQHQQQQQQRKKQQLRRHQPQLLEAASAAVAAAFASTAAYSSAAMKGMASVARATAEGSHPPQDDDARRPGVWEGEPGARNGDSGARPAPREGVRRREKPVAGEGSGGGSATGTGGVFLVGDRAPGKPEGGGVATTMRRSKSERKGLSDRRTAVVDTVPW